MRPLFVPLALLLTACGSNLPPSSEGNLSMQALNLPAPTGNQDRDFARTMIAYHQSAIDLARRQQSRGSDPALRDIASKSIPAREQEIAALNAYLQRTGGR
jgi:uncharacterized protein (DUF305 family)